MSKIRREKDLIRNTTERFLKATTQDYVRYFEGSPTHLIYYQLDSEASKQDTSLESVHSLFGRNSPLKYKLIDNVIVYGLDAIDVSNQLDDVGLRSTIDGEFVFLPDSISPSAGDFFIFDYDGMREHLFRIEDVQFDKATPKKFYRCSFKIYPLNESGDGSMTDFIENISDEYTLQYENIGGKETTILKKSVAATAESLMLLSDSLIDEYTSVFYDEDMDSFLFRYYDETAQSLIGVWSPYLRKFIHKNKVLKKYEKKILEEIFIMDVNEREILPYSEVSYRNSLFKKVETQDSNLTFNNTFMGLGFYDLQEMRNLPFSHIDEPFKSLSVHETLRTDTNGITFFMSAFHLLYRGVEDYYSLPTTKKFSDPAELGTTIDVLPGDLLYRYGETLGEMVPTEVYRASVNSETLEVDIYPAGFNDMVNETYTWDKYLEDDLFKIIRSYLRGKLIITEDLTAKLTDMVDSPEIVLNDIYIEENVRNYILIPLVIHIFKQNITDSMS